MPSENTYRIHRFGDLARALTEAPDRDAALARGDAHIAERLEKMLDERGGAEAVLSLDVFDTVLLRDDSAEVVRFREVGAAMAAHVARDGGAPEAIDGFLARHMGTLASYRAGPRVEDCREGDLGDIHRTASVLLTGRPDHADAFVEIELAHEARRVRLNEALGALVARHRDRGGRVLMLSDMYLRAAHIARLLEGAGLPRSAYDALISSAETKLSKASGGVFALAEAELSAPATRFVHAGDSFVGDYVRPRERGWAALHLPIPEACIDTRRRAHHAALDDVRSRHGIALTIAAPA